MTELVAAGGGNLVPPPALSVRGLCKRFAGQQALADVNLVIRGGEVHGLLGENGSGKSTLIKILAGYHVPDAGELVIAGTQIAFPIRPGQARKFGLKFVHQELALIPSLSVLDNLMLDQLAVRKDWRIDWKRARRDAVQALSRHGVDIDIRRPIAGLTPLERALVAIVRAVDSSYATGDGVERATTVLVLDEPTVFLPKKDADRLFALIRGIAQSGAGVLFVSHDLDEAVEGTDMVTVLRDGRVVDNIPTKSVTKDELIESILGRQLQPRTPSPTSGENPGIHVSVKRLRGTTLGDLTLDASVGQVIGLTGLVGSGAEEIPYLVYGATAAGDGQLRIGHRTLDLATITPSSAMEAGIALIPADRRRDGSVVSLSITDNVTLVLLRRFFKTLLLRRRSMTARTRELMEDFDVRPRKPDMPYGQLSGGNQQKALLAKWLQLRPELLLLHEPTNGVDVGAREQVFDLIRKVAKMGTVILCASTDYEQLSVICDRVMIFNQGRLATVLCGQEVTEENIAVACYASGEDASHVMLDGQNP